MVEKSASGKFTEPLLNTPKSVTAVPKEVIEEKQVKDLRDLARTVPGLTIGSAEGGNSFGAFAIRGFKANNDIFIDGIRNPGNVIPDLFSVEQVEIYKGPSGGIAGRSTIGGAVNLVTKEPDLNFDFGVVTTTVGTDNTFRTTLDVNQRITHDFAVRANLMYDQNDVAGRDFADTEKWGGLLSATARVTDDVKVTLDYYHYKNDSTPDWGVPILSTQHVPQTELGMPRSTWFGEKDLDFYHEDADIGTATVVAKLAEGITLTNRTRVGASTVDYVATSAEGGTYHHPQRDQDARLYANQTELNVNFTTGNFRHEVVAGLELSREEISRSSYTVSPSTAAIPSVNGIYVSDPYRHAAIITGKAGVYDATIDTVGLYIEDTVHLSKQWIVNGGVRFDDFSRDQVAAPGAAATNTAKVQDDLWSWHAGIVYKPIDIASIYAAYATSQSPVGSELDSTGAQYNGLSSTLVNAPPQEARSVEVGTKWELFDKRLLATAALFQTDVDHARTNDGVAAPFTPATAFAGEYRVRGIELGAAGNITKEWSVFGGLTLLDTKVLASSTAQDIGRRLANIPLTQFSLMSRYQLTKDFAVGGTATYGGEMYGGHLAANAANNHTVDWWRFDAFAEYDLTKNIEIEVTGLNLTNELYYDSLYQSAAAPPGGTFAFVAPGRAGYATIKYKY
jgi:catecholate siderophore receptor